MTMPKRRGYPTDLSDEEWATIEPFVPKPKLGPNPRKHELREIVNALIYKAKTGCQWRMLPSDFAPWHTVSSYFYRWRDEGVFEDILKAINGIARLQSNREHAPSLGIVDSQSVKSSHGGEAIGIDGAKRVHGRKRHIMVDALGLLLAVIVTAANVCDRTPYRELAHAGRATSPRLEKILVDSAYNGDAVRIAEQETGIVAEMSKRSDAARGFVPEMIRWRVERTFGWFNYMRQLSREYDRTVASSEAWVQIVGIHYALRAAA
jgi:putative transposase